MALQLDILLAQAQRLAGGNAQLPVDQIKSGDLFSDRMFNLQTGIHLHKPETICAQSAAAICNKLNCSGPFIANRLCGGDSGLCHCGTDLIWHIRGRGFFNNFLMPSLHRTVSFKQMQMGALAVRQHLHFNMARGGDVFFNDHMPVTKGGNGLTYCTHQKLSKSVFGVHFPHAFAAATGPRLDQHRIADICGLSGQHIRALVSPVIARDNRNTCRCHQPLGFIFQPHCPHGFCGWPDKNQSCCTDRFGKVRVFG